MKYFMRLIVYLIIVSSLIFALSFSGLTSNETTIPTADFPVLNTSAGQSAAVETLNLLAEEAGLKYDYCDVPTFEMIDAGVGLAGVKTAPGIYVEILTDLEKYPVKTPYKTIIFAIGASAKGMGSSGLTISTEKARLKKIIDYCKKNKIYIIAMHLGGPSARGVPGSDNEEMIDAVAPFANYIIVTKDGNKDGRFNTIAEKNEIPITEIEYALDLVDTLKQIFQLDV